MEDQQQHGVKVSVSLLNFIWIEKKKKYLLKNCICQEKLISLCNMLSSFTREFFFSMYHMFICKYWSGFPDLFSLCACMMFISVLKGFNLHTVLVGIQCCCFYTPYGFSLLMSLHQKIQQMTTLWLVYMYLCINVAVHSGGDNSPSLDSVLPMK